MSLVQIVRVGDAMPDGFDRLRDEARSDGWTHMDRLEAAWTAGELLDCEQAVFAALVCGELAGICALTTEPSGALPNAYRMRHFYVGEAFRGQGVGRALAGALIQQGLSLSNDLTVNAVRPGSRAFWEAMGFVADERNGWSHRYLPSGRMDKAADEG